MESSGNVDITLFPNADELKDKNVLVRFFCSGHPSVGSLGYWKY